MVPLLAHAHAGQRRHHAVHLPKVGDPRAALHLGCRQLGDRREHRGHGDIDPNIDGAKLAFHLVGSGFNGIRIRHIRGNRKRANAMPCAKLCRGGLQPVGLPGEQRNIVALTRELLGSGASHTCTGSRNHDDFGHPESFEWVDGL